MLRMARDYIISVPAQENLRRERRDGYGILAVFRNWNLWIGVRDNWRGGVRAMTR